MAIALDKELSRKVFLRMRAEGANMVHVLGVLAELNPKANDDDIVLFVAECLKNPFEPDKPEK